MKLIYLQILICFLITSCNDTNKTNPEVIVQKETFDVAYANTSSAQKLDIFLPLTGNVPYPVLIWIHGGGWKSGDKSQFRNSDNKAELLDHGYAVIVINYRLSGEAKFPAQIFDVKAAIRWIRANSSKYQLNPDKIGVWGSSAGGHLSALAGTSGAVHKLEDLSLGNSTYTSKVQAVVDWFGPVDLLKLDNMALAQGCSSSDHNAADSPESELIGYKITTRPDIVDIVNPITYISVDDPPFFIEHGLADCTIAYGQSQLLYDNLLPILGSQKVKIKFLPKTGHGGGLFDNTATVKEAIDFLDTCLK
jgi:acetyl esterase/lipase